MPFLKSTRVRSSIAALSHVRPLRITKVRTAKHVRENTMQDVLRKTFGGLSRQYYLRQLFFGALFLALIVWTMLQSKHGINGGMIAFAVISTLLYPYSRFVYESIINFIIGNNVFFGNAIMMMTVKLMTMVMCWSMAIFIAPVGLVYLYFYHRRAVG
jgi:hypothetical protein